MPFEVGEISWLLWFALLLWELELYFRRDDDAEVLRFEIVVVVVVVVGVEVGGAELVLLCDDGSQAETRGAYKS